MKNIKDNKMKKEKINRESVKKALLDFRESLKDMPIAKNEEEQKELDKIWEGVDALANFMKGVIKDVTKK